MRDGRVFRGKVIHAKTLEPIAAAAVTLLGWDRRAPPLGMATTTDDGAYEVSAARPGEVEAIEVRKGGLIPGRISLGWPGETHDFELESGRLVKGRVRFADGRPATTGWVWVLEKGEWRVPVASSDACFPVAADGTFAALAGGHEVAVLAVGHDFRPRLSELFDLREPADAEVLLEVEPARSLTGIVQDAAGKPIAAASVHTWLSLSEAGPPMEDFNLEMTDRNPLDAIALTDAEGRFSIAGLAAEPATVSVRADGFRGREIEEAGDTPVLVTLETLVKGPTRALSVAVTGLPAGRRLPEHAYLVGERYHKLMGLAGESYVLSELGTDAGKGWIQVPGYARVRAEWPEGSESHHLGEIRLAPGRVVDLAVLDGEGQGIAGATVILNRGSTWCATYSGVTDVRFETDAQGLLSLGGLWEESHSLEVSKEGFVTRDTYFNVEEHSGRLDVVLAREARIRGRVLGRGGEPLLRARVVVPHEEHAYAADFTDWTGAFLVSGIPAGTKLTGIVYSAGTAPTPFEVPPLEPGRPLDVGDLSVLPGETLAGTAVDDEGRPLADKTVFISLEDEDREDLLARWWGELPPVETDDKGHFEHRGLLPGKYRLSVYQEDGASQERVVTVPTSGPFLFGPDDPDLQAYAGLVRNSDGTPVAGATVRLWSRELREDNFNEDVTTRADGRFKLHGVPRDLVLPVVSARHGLRSKASWARSVPELPGEIVLEQGGSLAIRVEKEEELGEPGHPSLRLLRENGRELGTVGAVENGSLIRADDVPPGTYTGVIEARGCFPVKLVIEVRHDQPFAASVTMRRLPPGRPCTFQVKSSKGTPLKHAWVMCELSRIGRQRVPTDEDGIAELTLISAIDNEVTVDLKGYYPARLDLAEIGERRVVEVILHPNGGLRAQVTIPGDPRDVSYHLELEPLDVPRWKDYSRDGIYRVTEPGKYSFPGLPAGRYAVVASSSSEENQNWILARQEITVTDGSTTEIQLELPAHFQVRGTVTEKGSPLAGKQVYLSYVKDGSEYCLRARLDQGGRFSQSACVTGKYTISVVVDGEILELGAVEIPGATDLSLELKR